MKRSTKLSTRMTWDPESCVSETSETSSLSQERDVSDGSSTAQWPVCGGTGPESAREWRVPRGGHQEKGHLIREVTWKNKSKINC